MTLNEADKIVHPVETQWHYSTLIEAGYDPVTLSAVGFVRRYKYVNHSTGNTIFVSTGVSSDYWTDDEEFGYWSDLPGHLKKVNTPNMVTA